MNFNEYQQACNDLSLYDPNNVAVLALGLCGEAGEVADKIKKVYRDETGIFTFDSRRNIVLEAGDTLWYLGQIGLAMGYDLETLANMNLQKLWDRKARGAQRGSGDNR